MDTLRDNYRDMTDIIHDNPDSDRLREKLKYDEIVEDIVADEVLHSDRFYSAVVDNMVHAITHSGTLNFPQRVRDIVTDDDKLKDELRTIIKKSVGRQRRV